MSDDKNILDRIGSEVDKVKSKNSEENSDGKSKIDDEQLSVMDKLVQDEPIEVPEPGDIMKGRIVSVAPKSVLIDLGSFGTGISMGKEAKDGLRGNKKFEIGDKVSVVLLELENEDGFIELSIKEASYEKAWEDLESKRDNEETVETRILDANKGGLMVEVNGVNGFLPVSQLANEHYPRVDGGNKNKILEKLKKLTGQFFTVKIIGSDREEEKLIVSEKAALSEKEQKVISKLKKGDIVEGEVSGVVNFGAFVKFYPDATNESANNQLEGLVHISELAWQLIKDPAEIVKVGDKLKAKIIGIDESRISLSVRALEKNPWDSVSKKYKVGDTHKGTVDKINNFGAFVYLDKDIHGLAHISEFGEAYPGKKLEEMVEEGKEYQWKILSLEPAGHRMGLLLVTDGMKEIDKKVEDVKKK